SPCPSYLFREHLRISCRTRINHCISHFISPLFVLFTGTSELYFFKKSSRKCNNPFPIFRVLIYRAASQCELPGSLDHLQDPQLFPEHIKFLRIDTVREEFFQAFIQDDLTALGVIHPDYFRHLLFLQCEVLDFHRFLIQIDPAQFVIFKGPSVECPLKSASAHSHFPQLPGFCFDAQFFLQFPQCAFRVITSCVHMPCGGDVVAPRIGFLCLAPPLQEDVVSAEIIGSHYPDMHRCVKGALSVRHASLLYNAGLCPVRIPLVKQLHGHTVKGRILQDILSIVHKLQRKEVPLLIQQPEEDLVPLPDFHPPYCILFHPFELSLIAFNGVSLESVRGVQRHVFHH